MTERDSEGRINLDGPPVVGEIIGVFAGHPIVINEQGHAEIMHELEIRPSKENWFNWAQVAQK